MRLEKFPIFIVTRHFGILFPLSESGINYANPAVLRGLFVSFIPSGVIEINIYRCIALLIVCLLSIFRGSNTKLKVIGCCLNINASTESTQPGIIGLGQHESFLQTSRSKPVTS